jgi:GntR family transcriptional regulator/MocR family aminotransferase
MSNQTNSDHAASWAPVLEIALDAADDRPLFRRLHAALRARILARDLPRGTRLPSTRGLAARLGISRASVVAAYDQLTAEGFLEGRVGAGSYVAVDVPADAAVMPYAVARASRPPLAARRRRIEGAAPKPQPAMPAGVPFESGMVQVDARMRAAWRSTVIAQAGQIADDDLRYGDPRGDPTLRAAIADYLRVARGMRADRERVLITTGSQQSYDLLIKLLLDPGDQVWVEDPGYPALRAALIAAGARLMPVAVDRDGMDVAGAIARRRAARLVFVTPSHHYPTGATLALARRVQLVEWAERSGAWIVEDDYDGEFRFARAPLSPLHALGGGARVIYLGTFNKVLFPGLRLGYVLAEPELVAALAAERRLADHQPATMLQRSVAQLMREGHFASHVRRMRQRYLAARDTLVGALRRRLADRVEIVPPEQGMQLPIWLPRGMDDRILAARAATRGVAVKAISPMHLAVPRRHGLLLGYAGFDEHALRSAAARLARAFDD